MSNATENDRTASLPIEPYDKEWGIGVNGTELNPSPFPRINRLIQFQRDGKFPYMGTVDAQRAQIVTEGYKNYAAYPQNLKWAMILRDIFQKVDIHIYPDELLVGEMAAPANAAPVYPEFSYDWVCEEIREKPLDKRANDKYYMTESTKQKLLAMEEDWENKTVWDYVHSTFTEKEERISHLGKKINIAALFIEGGVGHVCINYEKIFKIGFGGIRRQVEEKLAQLDTSLPENSEKEAYYRAELITLEGVVTYITRFGELAKTMAQDESDMVRRFELERISSNCLQVAEGPARDFWEALQIWQLATDMVYVESNGHSATYGRFDKIFYPYYKQDLKNGTFTREFMQELIESAYIKIDQLRKLRNADQIFFASGQNMGGTALDLGGVDQYGKDITNDLSYMALDAHAHTRIANPWIGVRLHEGSPYEFKVKTYNVILIGTGEPKIYNDDSCIAAVMRFGKTLEDARDYVGIGCVELAVPAKMYGWHDVASFNLSLAMHMAINHGHCINCGEACKYYDVCAGAGGGLSIDTGGLDEFQSFDEVLASYSAQLKYLEDNMLSTTDKMMRGQQKLKPLPYLSLVVDDCIEKGLDISLGGAHYNNAAPQAVGVGTTIDSLSVISQLVFDEKRVSGTELLSALKANWEGYEPLYALVNSSRMHQYGNDDDYADDIGRFVIDEFCDNIDHKPTPAQGEYMPGVFSVTCNVMHGVNTPATPDGRKDYEPLSDCLGPVHNEFGSHDHSGPTAIAKSVTKLDHSRFGNGMILNWKFSPTAVSGAVGRDNLMGLMDVYFENMGMESQFSIIGRDTMLDAQKHPERYQDLLVRIAGYSAYFVSLSEEVQNDLIGRTSLSFD
jgi:formate C-acetyltransferase